jgi:hypothetical protein
MQSQYLNETKQRGNEINSGMVEIAYIIDFEKASYFKGADLESQDTRHRKLKRHSTHQTSRIPETSNKLRSCKET